MIGDQDIPGLADPWVALGSPQAPQRKHVSHNSSRGARIRNKRGTFSPHLGVWLPSLRLPDWQCMGIALNVSVNGLISPCSNCLVKLLAFAPPTRGRAHSPYWTLLLLLEVAVDPDVPRMGPYGCPCAIIRHHGSGETHIRIVDEKSSEPWGRMASQSPDVGQGRSLWPH